jgi:hypothetical protein
VTERDLTMLLLSEDALLALGAVLGWQARAALLGSAPEELPVTGQLPA